MLDMNETILFSFEIMHFRLRASQRLIGPQVCECFETASNGIWPTHLLQ